MPIVDTAAVGTPDVGTAAMDTADADTDPAPEVTRDRVSTAVDLLEGARLSLVEASRARVTRSRYLSALLAALRSAAALVAVRGEVDRSGPRNLWELLPGVAPELVEWAEFFAHSTARRWAIDRGHETVSVREADDLLREAETFVGLVADLLGLPRPPLPVLLTPVSPSSEVVRE